jgi:hypothetical protein
MERQTTRVEEGAYCLMGRFDVHMPVLYGEGHKAFLRLQLEILRTSDDESLFASIAPPRYLQKPFPRDLGLLAEPPSWFSASGNTVRNQFDGYRPPFSITNKGVPLEVFAIKPPQGGEGWGCYWCLSIVGRHSLRVKDTLSFSFMKY